MLLLPAIILSGKRSIAGFLFRKAAFGLAKIPEKAFD